MSKTPLLCIALLACVQAQSQSPFGNYFRGPRKLFILLNPIAISISHNQLD